MGMAGTCPCWVCLGLGRRVVAEGDTAGDGPHVAGELRCPEVVKRGWESGKGAGVTAAG